MKSVILDCNVWCVADDRAKDLGLPEGDSWMPFAIDLTTISAIKLCGENEFLGSDKSTIHYPGGIVTLDVPYTELVKLWKEAMDQ